MVALQPNLEKESLTVEELLSVAVAKWVTFAVTENMAAREQKLEGKRLTAARPDAKNICGATTRCFYYNQLTIDYNKKWTEVPCYFRGYFLRPLREFLVRKIFFLVRLAFLDFLLRFLVCLRLEPPAGGIVVDLRDNNNNIILA